ncbi:MAG: N-formylglutamate amidohydrolase [Roseibium sp.]|uniref:N-formylglutamate amidohydrolase n=1 Tax=Roseibium sp. TaxID=1936156 RepID=UPI001B10EBA1|nr:N-formylglutamate amidohydrolase [Roseibium sp.]MBO6891634.1 N-formylglutamate amidohydrolase [Roseibium sp.]MBO6929845.1 N-formylglutamate amidohydrolase [Roseibium sp.]
MTPAVRTVAPVTDPVPLVFDSPHSGSIYPDDFRHAIDRMTLRRSEDAHVEELFAPAVREGAYLVHALFPRCYVDPNRNSDDIDLSMIDGTWDGEVNPTFKTLQRGVGLIWKDMKAFGPVYDRKLTAAEIRHRIDGFWRPYHQELQRMLDELHGAHGQVLHVNCHSMASMGDRTTEDGEVPRPDFVIGDRDGSTCSPRMTDCVAETLRQLGYSVAVNDPYKGFELVRRHGRPQDGRHSIQIEINRRLYMDEATLSKVEGFLPLEENLTVLTRALCDLARDPSRL